MAVKVAFLRGINVGGNKLVPMADLKAAMEEAGFKPVKTHLNSGNVVFEAGDLSDEKAAAAVRKAVKDCSGVDCSVQVRSASELKRALKADPYPEESGSRLIINFLDGDPKAEGVARLEGWEGGHERTKAIGREIFTAFGDGMGQSKLAALNWPKLLGVEVTGRNRNTVQKLVEIAETMGG